jgi:hypothetical protein
MGLLDKTNTKATARRIVWRVTVSAVLGVGAFVAAFKTSDREA